MSEPPSQPQPSEPISKVTSPEVSSSQIPPPRPGYPDVIEILDDLPESSEATTSMPKAGLLPPADLQKKAALPQSSTPPFQSVPSVPIEDRTPAALAPFQSSFVAQFQTNFQVNEPPTADAKAKKQSKLAPKVSSFQRTSISSLMNTEENSSVGPSAKQPEKKRKPASKAESSNKKAKAEPKKEAATANATKASSDKVLKGTTPNAAGLAPEVPKKEPKKVNKKKTPEASAAIKEKLPINPTVTANKQKIAPGPLNLPNPGFLDLEPGTSGKESESKENAEKTPVIFLDVPLLDPTNPKPGQAEVVINVLKLAEDKYGWNAIHPDARSAIDMMDDILDDDDEGDDDEGDDDLQIIEDKGKKDNKENEGKNGVDNKDEDLKKWRAQQTKINRKVGKYDYEDPFIDDAELQWEEEITTTKEGFFVYWGPLVDERSGSSAKKGPGKLKK